MLCVRGHLGSCFPDAVSYNRPVGLMPRVSFRMTLFMKLRASGKCPGISFADSATLPVCRNRRRRFNKVFKDIAADGKGTMGWCHGFKLRLLCNGCGEIITSCLTRADADGRDDRVRNVSAGGLYGKVFAGRGHIRRALFEGLSDRGIHLVHGLQADMRNRLMPVWDKIMSRKRHIIKCVNELFKNKAGLVLTPPVGKQLHDEHLPGSHRLLLLRQQTGGSAPASRKDRATWLVLIGTENYPELA